MGVPDISEIGGEEIWMQSSMIEASTEKEGGGIIKGGKLV